MVDRNVESTIRNSDDTKLLTMLSNPDDYLPEAIAVARDEIENRGGLEAVNTMVHAKLDVEARAEEAESDVQGKRSTTTKQSKTRTFFGYLVAAAVMATFSTGISPSIDSILGVVIGWFIAFLVAIGLGGLVAGKSI